MPRLENFEVVRTTISLEKESPLSVSGFVEVDGSFEPQARH
jgi:hypothetical protein